MNCQNLNTRHHRLIIEHLESRELMAGDVTAAIDRLGTLRITGDAKANCVELDFTDKLVLRGCNAGGTTTINRADQPFTVAGAIGRDVFMRLQGGDDVVRIGRSTSLTLGDVQVQAGEGNNDVAIAANVTIDGDLQVQTGSGEDKVQLQGQVNGRVSVATGSRRDELILLAGQFSGPTTIDSGAGDDQVNLKDMQFLRRVSVITEAGKDFVEIDDSTFAGPVDVVLGQDDDSLYVGGITSEGSIFQDETVNFVGGAGKSDRRAIENSVFAGEPLVGELLSGFEIEVDDRSDLKTASNPAASLTQTRTKYRDCSNRLIGPGVNLSKCDLRPLPLAGKDLTNANMSSANLAGMNLDVGPDDPRTNMTGVNLSKADLTNTVLSNTILRGASLNRASATGASFEDTDLQFADLASADLRNAKLFFTDARDASFRRANLAGAELIGANLPDADLNRANLQNVVATAATFTGADLTLADLTGANLTRADLTGARLHRTVGLTTVIWSNTICPDGTNSNDNAGTCVNNL